MAALRAKFERRYLCAAEDAEEEALELIEALLEAEWLAEPLKLLEAKEWEALEDPAPDWAKLLEPPKRWTVVVV